MNLIEGSLTYWLLHKLGDALGQCAIKDHINVDLIAGTYWFYGHPFIKIREMVVLDRYEGHRALRG